MTTFFAYIDPSASSLLIQLALSFALGSFFIIKRGILRAGRFLNAESVAAGPWSAIVAISFASVAMFRIWAELFGYKRADTFEMKHPPLPSHYVAALLACLIIATIVWPVVVRGAKPGRTGKVFSTIFLLLCFVPLNGLRDVLGYRYFPMLRFSAVRVFGPFVVGTLAVGFAGTLIVAIVLYQRFLARIVFLVLLVGSPFSVILSGASLMHAVRYSAFGFQDQSSIRRSSGRGKSMRVVWVIFDEMDQRLAFEDRPAGLEMPEFDNFRQSAFYSDSVSEAGNNTIFAIPSLMIGRKIIRVREADVDELQVSFEAPTSFVSFKTIPNIFSRLRDLGLSTGLAAWGTPYCRMFGGQLARCWWCESARPDNSIRDDVMPATIDSLRSLFETPNFSIFGQSLCTRQHIKIYESVNREAFSIASDPQIDVSLIQLTGAHPPHFYNRKTGDFSLANSPVKGYTDSLALCDITLRRLRLAMQAAGVWENTVVIVSSDHHSRSSGIFDGKIDHRVVFMVKFPGQGRGVYFNRPISALATGALIVDIATDRVRDPSALTDWMNHRASNDELAGSRKEDWLTLSSR